MKYGMRHTTQYTGFYSRHDFNNCGKMGIMLVSLKIQNIALIPEVEIEFGPNFNVLSGETGAGKSIILGSLNFILGDKLNKNMIRTGTAKASVDAVFSVDENLGSRINEICGIDIDDGTVIISRTLKADGKTECRINSSPVTTSVLKEVANSLIHIHGQHDTETVLRVKNHLNILDMYGGGRISALASIYRGEYDNWKSLEAQLKSLGGDESERARQIDLYTFQISEIENANLQIGEDEELQEKKTKFQNFEKIANGLSMSIANLSGDEGGATSLLKNALSGLGGISNFDTKLEKLYDELSNVQYALADVEGELSSYFDSMEMDAEEFAYVDSRLDEIKALKRKYGNSIEAIHEYLEKTKSDLNKLVSNEQEVEKTKTGISKSLVLLKEHGTNLSNARREVATDLETKIIEQLTDLEMKSTKFKVEFKESSFKPDGIDDIEFLFSANIGEPLRPLASIISGGEMSRFMLALKTLIAENDKIGTMIFDEIDTGIGGNMGTKIGNKMAHLSRHSQIICVTHLAQVAAQANTHFLIKKMEQNDRTATTVYPLNKEARLAEIARMIGGEEKNALEFARSLVMSS